MKNLLFTLSFVCLNLGYAQEWHILDTNNSGIMYNSVFGLYEDDSENIWVGIPIYGSQKFDRQEWVTYSVDNSNMPLDQVMCIAQDADGNYWFGSPTDGVAKWDGINWTHYTSQNSDLPTNGIFSFLLDSNQNFWIGTQYGGAIKIDTQQNWTVYNTSDGISDNVINTIFEDSQGVIWFGTENRMTSYDGQDFTTYNVLPQYGSPTVVSIQESSNGDLWFALEYLGLLRYDGSEWTWYYRNSMGLSANTLISSSVMDENDNLLLTTYGDGLIYKNVSDDFATYPGSESLPTQLNKIIMTQNNEIVIGSYFAGLIFNGELNLNSIDYEDRPTINLYPNPVVDKINIELSGDTIKSIKIYNLQGQKLLEPSPSNSINFSNVPNGLYFININTKNGKRYYKKFLKKN